MMDRHREWFSQLLLNWTSKSSQESVPIILINFAFQQLGLLLNYATKLKKEANLDLKLFTSCALFVCNMWDQIPAENVEEVRRAQIENLTKKLKDLDEKSQIIYLSCQRAQLAQKYGVITEDFDQLLDGISNLVVSSMQSNLQIYSR